MKKKREREMYALFILFDLTFMVFWGMFVS